MVKRKKRVTISDAAELADVSTMTVSRVINNKPLIKPETRARVMQAIQQLDFKPNHIAQSLTNDQTFTLGVVVIDIANPFFAEIMAGIETTSWENGYNVILCNTQENMKREREVLRMSEAKQVDGVIVCSARLPDEEFYPLIKAFNAAIVFNRRVPDDVAGTVLMDDIEGAVLLVEHLITYGRTRLGMIAGSEMSRSAEARIQGFRSAAPSENPPIERSLTAHIQPSYEVTKRLLQKHPYLDGLLCHNDLAAIGAAEACRELGLRVPDDIAIVGCDDIPLASSSSNGFCGLG